MEIEVLATKIFFNLYYFNQVFSLDVNMLLFLLVMFEDVKHWRSFCKEQNTFLFFLTRKTVKYSFRFRVYWVRSHFFWIIHFKMRIILGKVLFEFHVLPTCTLECSRNVSALHQSLWVQKKLVSNFHSAYSILFSTLLDSWEFFLFWLLYQPFPRKAKM